MHPSLFPCHKADTKFKTNTDRKAKWKRGGGGDGEGGRDKYFQRNTRFRAIKFNFCFFGTKLHKG